jgi:HAD superfamily hydrolase (TIGR01549 family)
MYRALFIDLDNTMYDYDSCHIYALDMLGVDMVAYNEARDTVKINKHTHDRSEYFELIKKGEGAKLTESYWYHIVEKIALFEGVLEFIRWHKDNNIPVCIITDFDRPIQQRKLKALGIDHLIDHVVCCSDTGCDKPSPLMFLLALNKVNRSAIECCMIGDSIMADIKGANNVGIHYTFHYGTDFTSYPALLERLNSEQRILANFIKLCKAVSERPDWIQACGGNISVKLQTGNIVIKSSGEHLSNVSLHGGYVMVDKYGNHVLCSGRPSIETSFHLKIKHMYVIHVHSIATIATPPDVFQKLYTNAQILPYINPGKDIADAVLDSSDTIYLQNHGLIIASNTSEGLVSTLDQICKTCEIAVGLNFDRYRELSTISDKIRLNNPTYVTLATDIITDTEIKKYTPDIAVYCSNCIITANNNKYYISGTNIDKCRNIKDILDSIRYLNNVSPLDLDTVRSLCRRSDEQYRMNS